MTTTPDRAGLTVGAVAKLSGLTVRTLHHYDDIGLLSPSDRSAAGYRLYATGDLARLQEILLFRELGFSLEHIAEAVDDPEYDRARALAQHRELLEVERLRLDALIRSVDAALEAETKGHTMSEKEMFEVFGDFDPAHYRAEAEERWGGTDAYAESVRRTDSYTADDWSEVLAEGEGIAKAFAAAMTAGVGPEDAAAMDIAESHRQYTSNRFYECPYEIHVGLGEMYVADERFTAYWDAFAPGLAEYVSTAITANALRAD